MGLPRASLMRRRTVVAQEEEHPDDAHDNDDGERHDKGYEPCGRPANLGDVRNMDSRASMYLMGAQKSEQCQIN